MIRLQESISESLKQQGIECGTGQRHCRLTPLTSKMKIQDLEERCQDMEKCEMYEMVTDIILDRKSSQKDAHRPLQRIHLPEKTIITADQSFVCKGEKWKFTQIRNYDYDEFYANEKSDQDTIFEIMTKTSLQHESSSCDPPPQYESLSKPSPPPKYESPPRYNILSQNESSPDNVPPQYDSPNFNPPPQYLNPVVELMRLPQNLTKSIEDCKATYVERTDLYCEECKGIVIDATRIECCDLWQKLDLLSNM